MGDENGKVCLIGGLIALGALVLIVTLSMSFSDVNYYEYGFLRRKSTGAVSLAQVYTTGRYCVGPDYEFKVFKADAHLERLTNIAIFTSDKLEVTLSATFQYFLRKEDLAKLHDAYDIYYKPILRTNAVDALKGAATVFTTREFISNRSEIENILFNAVRDRLGGPCCAPNCDIDGASPIRYENCVPGCIARSSCTNFGLFATVAYFQLGYIDIPNDVEERYLRALVLNEEGDRELFIQQAQVVRKITEQEVNEINNQAEVIKQNATAQAQLILSKANANYTATLEMARSTGLKNLYSDLGLSNVDHKMSFDYLRTLRDMKNAHLTVDFDQMIVGPMKAGP